MTPLLDTSSAKPRLCLPPEAWPPAIAKAWQELQTQPRNPFRRRGRLRRPITTHNYQVGLGRYLAYLQSQGQLTVSEDARDLISLERLDGYFIAIRKRGCSDHTILSAFSALRGALHLLYPKDDFSFVTKPHGIPLKRALEMQRRDLFIPDARAAALWAVDLFQQALVLDDPMQRRLQVRDAVMIIIFAIRAPRPRAMISLRLDRNLKRVNDEWILIQEGPIMKDQRTVLELPLGKRASTMLDRYLTVERMELLQEQQHQALWVAKHGGPLCQGSMNSMIAKHSKARFGTGFGPHRFRTSLTTTRAILGGEFPFDAPLILGHGPLVSLQNYNRANAVAASRNHDALIDAEEDAAMRIRRHYLPGTSSRLTDTTNAHDTAPRSGPLGRQAGLRSAYLANRRRPSRGSAAP